MSVSYNKLRKKLTDRKTNHIELRGKTNDAPDTKTKMRRDSSVLMLFTGILFINTKSH